MHAERLARLAREAGPAHFVGHSLGGLIALEALRSAPDLAVPRVVCLGSPLCGSLTARNLAGRAWTRPLLGRSAPLLQAGLQCWDGPAEVGVVAGDELQAALLRVKLKYIDADNARRREISQRYRREIKNPAVRLPSVRAGEDSHVWHLFVVRVPDRAAFQQRTQ